MIMKGCVQWDPVYGLEVSPRALLVYKGKQSLSKWDLIKEMICILSLSRFMAIEKGGQNENGRDTSPDSVNIHNI